MKTKKIIMLFIFIMCLNCISPLASTYQDQQFYMCDYKCINGKLYKFCYINKTADCIVNEEKTQEIAIDQNSYQDQEYTFNDIIYYGNISLKQSLQITPEIAAKATSLVKNLTYDYDKAYELYKFVSNYIAYDLNRARQIANKQYISSSWKAGAQYGWDNKSGVCFEYATLYAAMAHQVGLKVRLDYADRHIWNEIYDSQTGKWRFVDCTWRLFNTDINKYHKSYIIHAEF